MAKLVCGKMPQQVYPERELEESRKDRSELNLSNNRDQQTRNELSEQLSQTFGPTLFVMKLAGDFFGETTLTEPRDLNSNWGNSAYCISRFYSSFVVLAEWLLVVLGLITLFYQGLTSMNVFLFLLIVITYYIQCASNATICSVVLPLVKRKNTRFSQFISGAMMTATDLDGVKRKTLQGLVIACFVAMMNFVCITLFSLYNGGIISKYKPWNGHSAVRVIELAPAIYGSFSWSLPVQLYCATCLVLERMFETLKKKVESSLGTERPLTIAFVRQEHMRLCKLLEMADRVFSPILCVTVILYIPLICVNLYQLIESTKNWSSEAGRVSFIAYLCWSIFLASILGVLCLFGSRVNEKVLYIIATERRVRRRVHH